MNSNNCENKLMKFNRLGKANNIYTLKLYLRHSLLNSIKFKVMLIQ